MITITINDRIADEIRMWAQRKLDWWPKYKTNRIDLADLLKQLDANLPSPEDVRGILKDENPTPT